MLHDVRRQAVPLLDAWHEHVDLRTPSLRVCFYRGHNVASDYALLERVAPFLGRLQRPSLTIVLAGSGRFEEGGARAWLEGGQLTLSDEARGGTEAYAGREHAWLSLGWDPRVLGAPFSGRFVVDRIAERDRRRLLEAALRLAGPHAEAAAGDVCAILRSVGLPLEKWSPRDLERRDAAVEQRVQRSLGAQLSRLEERPAIEDLATELNANVRSLHRRVGEMADHYAFPWAHWRSALHYTRMLHALRLLAAPGATTELVASLTGFRAPTALCHAFAKGGLPSPGALARAARREVLDAWTSFHDRGDDVGRAAAPAIGER